MFLKSVHVLCHVLSFNMILSYPYWLVIIWSVTSLFGFCLLRDAQRCSGTTQQWESTCIPTGLVCTSVQSAAKPSWRVQNWRGINSYTQGRNLSRWVLWVSVSHVFPLVGLSSSRRKKSSFIVKLGSFRNASLINVSVSCDLIPDLSFYSAHLRAVASGSPWTLTCAHMCASTLETAHMCAPLMAATRNLLSRPTWSLTSSHTQKLRTTSESTLNQANSDIWPASPWQTIEVPWPALLWDKVHFVLSLDRFK